MDAPVFFTFKDHDGNTALIVTHNNYYNYYACIDKLGFYHGDYMASYSPSDIQLKLERHAAIGKLEDAAIFEKEIRFNNAYYEKPLNPKTLCNFIYDYEADIQKYNKDHRNGNGIAIQQVTDSEGNIITFYQDIVDQTIVYQYKDPSGLVHGDFRSSYMPHDEPMDLTQITTFYPTYTLVPKIVESNMSKKKNMFAVYKGDNPAVATGKKIITDHGKSYVP